METGINGISQLRHGHHFQVQDGSLSHAQFLTQLTPNFSLPESSPVHACDSTPCSWTHNKAPWLSQVGKHNADTFPWWGWVRNNAQLQKCHWGSHMWHCHTTPWCGPPTQSAPRPAQVLLSCGPLAAHPMFQNEQGTWLKYCKPSHKCGSQLPRCARLSWDTLVKTNRKESHCPEAGQIRF